jgi:hypothetical protein
MGAAPERCVIGTFDPLIHGRMLAARSLRRTFARHDFYTTWEKAGRLQRCPGYANLV